MRVQRIDSRPFVAILIGALLITATPDPAAAQEQSARVISGSFGRAQLDLPAMTAIEVGPLGGGLARLEQRRPEITPLASRFRMQRRTGIMLGLVAVAGGIVAFESFADTRGSGLEWGDPSANLLVGSLGAMTLSIVQLEASHRTLARIAAGFRNDGSYGSAP